jgi:CheY-like chemotaxis protein
MPRFLKGDPTRIRQILMNLVNNAIKFTASGHVKITSSARSLVDGRWDVRFEVKDTGIGIPKEALERIFLSFSQADASTTRRFGGTGLGLSICRHLTKLMNGEIGVESKEGEGSVFWFTVKLEKSDSIGADALYPQKILPSRPRLRILVAEDNSVNQLIAVKMLEKMGHSVVTVASGNEVFDALRIAPYDLILMDCQMPQVDGYEATRIIRTSPTLNCNDIKIIAMTANAMAGDREKCLAAGMDDYVSKPMKPTDLEQVIDRVFPSQLS